MHYPLKNNSTLVIGIDDNSVKLVDILKTSSDYRITSVRKSVIVNCNNKSQPLMLKDAIISIKKILKSNTKTNKDLILVLPSYLATYKIITVQKSSLASLDETLKTQLKKHFFGIDLQYDFQILKETKDAYQILLAAIKKSDMAILREELNTSNLFLQQITIKPASLYNYFTYYYPEIKKIYFGNSIPTKR